MNTEDLDNTEMIDEEIPSIENDLITENITEQSVNDQQIVPESIPEEAASIASQTSHLSQSYKN